MRDSKVFSSFLKKKSLMIYKTPLRQFQDYVIDDSLGLPDQRGPSGVREAWHTWPLFEML